MEQKVFVIILLKTRLNCHHYVHYLIYVNKIAFALSKA